MVDKLDRQRVSEVKGVSVCLFVSSLWSEGNHQTSWKARERRLMDRVVASMASGSSELLL